MRPGMNPQITHPTLKNISSGQGFHSALQDETMFWGSLDYRSPALWFGERLLLFSTALILCLKTHELLWMWGQVLLVPKPWQSRGTSSSLLIYPPTGKAGCLLPQTYTINPHTPTQSSPITLGSLTAFSPFLGVFLLWFFWNQSWGRKPAVKLVQDLGGNCIWKSRGEGHL